jgi:PHP family Zn ribbon phosphoesterase
MIDGPSVVVRAAAWNAGTRCSSCLAIFKAQRVGGDREAVCGSIVKGVLERVVVESV